MIVQDQVAQSLLDTIKSFESLVNHVLHDLAEYHLRFLDKRVDLELLSLWVRAPFDKTANCSFGGE
jgi:hypothetical protein